MGQPNLDLFTSRPCHQLTQYISWNPDPRSITTNVFLHPLDKEYQFAFLPFSLISQVLRKSVEEKIDHSDTHTINSAVVYVTSKIVCTATISSASVKKFINKSTANHPLVETRSPVPNSLEDFQENL